MENNNLPLVLTRISLGITLLYVGILFVLSTPSSSDRSVGDGIGMMMVFLFPHLVTLIIATILNIIISYEKRYEQNDFFGTIVITLLSYIIFGIIVISIAPFLFYIFAIFFIPQTIFLILACLTFKKTEQK